VLSLVHVLEWRAAVNPGAIALLQLARPAAGFKCPTGATVVSELPRNATGKVLRARLVS
jgi:acyl-coenzyme A synthetase/AMP-(fatty) acid ligase